MEFQMKYCFTRRDFLRFAAGASSFAAGPGLSSGTLSPDHSEIPNARAGSASHGLNLVPEEPGSTPSYWCTWGIQNYSMEDVDENSHSMVANNLTEELLFERPGWAANYFPKIRRDLDLLFDLGWEVPLGLQFDKERWRLGTLEVATDKFPSCTGTPAERLRKLNELTRRAGWRGAAIWVPAQAPGDGKNGVLVDMKNLEEYFRQRARWTREAGIEYWKVDYGARGGDADFRHMLTRIAHEANPPIRVEHARGTGPVNDEDIPWENLAGHHTGRYRAWDDGKILRQAVELMKFSDILRTYDVTAYLSVPTTLDRVAQILADTSKSETANGIINCEDEPYIAAGLGCATGILRHPLWKDIRGKAYDPYQVRHRIDETTRAVRWQRLAPAWPVNQSPIALDPKIRKDAWKFHEGETWGLWLNGKEVVQSAPARVARGTKLPEVAAVGAAPFVIASRHPNGMLAVATLPRITAQQGIHFPLADVSIEVGAGDRPIGIFGRYRSLTLRLTREMGNRRIWAQDLAGDEAVDVTTQTRRDGSTLTLSGELIERVGLSAATPGDVSSPGMVLALRNR
jgi:hypothetical protein